MSSFFEQQEIARKKTGRLVLLFLLAVAATVASVYFAAFFAFVMLEHRGEAGKPPPSLFQPDLLVITTLGVLIVVTLGSLYKILSLRDGGRTVAEAMGARLLSPGAADPAERRLLNVVEEMALASGMPVPSVYVMDQERGINAFAAGFSSSDAVVGVTRGCIEKLSRDELQGVIAHEFSHIFNGDMRLNLKLMGVLHGILLIGLIGQVVLRSTFYGASVRRDRKGGGAVPILVFGVALAVIGFVGIFFGNLIKAAVSRQREFLADASAVQYTRNPGGIAGALKKIGGLATGSRLAQPNAGEVSHMLFGEERSRLTSLLATHPPIAERVRRIDPSFDGRFAQVAEGFSSEGGEQGVAAMGFASGAGAGPAPAAMAQAGQPSAQHLAHAHALVAGMPPRLRQAAQEPYGARAVVYGLLLDRNPAVRSIQLAALQRHADPGVLHELSSLTPELSALEPTSRLPLVDLALPALRGLTRAQYEAFVANLATLTAADGRMDLFEWVLKRVLIRHLAPNFGDASRSAVRYHSLSALGEPCSVLLSTLARLGHQTEDQVAGAFSAGAARLGGVSVTLLGEDRSGLRELERALDQLDQASFPLKQAVLEACTGVVTYDRQVTAVEADLYRAIADALGCPVPPLLPGEMLGN